MQKITKNILKIKLHKKPKNKNIKKQFSWFKLEKII